MDRTLFYKMEMFDGTLLVLIKYKLVWIDKIPFKTEVDRLTIGLGEINDFLLYDDSTEGATAEKNQVLDFMTDSTDSICEAGIAHASLINDAKLLAKFNFTPSDIRKGKEIEIYQRCMNIGASAIPVETELIEVGMSITQLAEQKAFCLQFRPLIGGAKKIRSGGKSNKEEMLLVYDEMDMIYEKRIDNMVGLLKKANPKFYIEYSNSRVIGFWKKKKEPPVTPDEPTPLNNN